MLVQSGFLVAIRPGSLGHRRHRALWVTLFNLSVPVGLGRVFSDLIEKESELPTVSHLW